GPNGSGKTTFINVVTGIYRPTAGRIELDGTSLEGLGAAGRNRRGLARTFQNLQLWRRMTVLENVMVGAHSTSHVGLVRALLLPPFVWRGERRVRERAWGLLHFVGLADRGRDLAGTLTFADQRRLEIARALASDPELLLLDEPAAGTSPSPASPSSGVRPTASPAWGWPTCPRAGASFPTPPSRRTCCSVPTAVAASGRRWPPTWIGSTGASACCASGARSRPATC